MIRGRRMIWGRSEGKAGRVVAWEEFYKSKKDQLVVYRDGDRYELWWENWGRGPEDVRKPVPWEAVESFLRGEHTGDDLISYARDGGWPHKRTPEEVEEASREFLRGSPIFLITIPENQRFFSVEELKELMPKARQALKEAEPYDPWAEDEDDLGDE